MASSYGCWERHRRSSSLPPPHCDFWPSAPVSAIQGGVYTQVFVHGDTVRALAGGLTLLPGSYAPELAKQADDLRAMAGQLARQWYGIGIAPKGGPDWLSEGLCAFLADSFVGQRLGAESYERQIERSRQVYNRLRAEGKDRPLSDAGFAPPGATGDELAIQKGVCFLYLVSELVGEHAFWDGLQLYTSEQWGGAAASEDFQKALAAVRTVNRAGKKATMRKNGGKENGAKNLDDLFDLWVYGIPRESAKPAKGK